MSNITVRIPVPLRPFVGDAAALDTDAETVGAALEQIGEHHPASGGLGEMDARPSRSTPEIEEQLADEKDPLPPDHAALTAAIVEAIKLQNREDGAKADQILITNDSRTTPVRAMTETPQYKAE